MSANTTRLLFVLCGLAWVVLVGRAWMNAKEPEDFVVTVTQDEIEAYAKQQLNTLQARSFANDQEFCAIIYEETGGTLGTSKIREGSEASCDIAYFDGPGMKPLASIHTHGSHDRNYDSEVPSLIDLNSDIESRTDGYIATPGGRLWRNDWQNKRSVLLCGEGCLDQDPAYKPCPADVLPDRFSFGELKQRMMGRAQMC